MAVPDELRLAVLRALGGEREVIGLRPVTVAEITDALAATGGDALVHLLEELCEWARCAPGTVFPPLAWAGFSHYGR